MFGSEVIVEARRHAAEAYPRESCGLVVDGRYLSRNNRHPEPEEHFSIAPQGYVAAAMKGEIQAVIHSHPDGQERPSYDDLCGQINSGLPWCILPRGKQEMWFGDQVTPAPLLGRRFIYGVHDCYTLGRDWYRLHRDILFPFVPTRWGWWENNEDLYITNLQSAGFRRLSLDEPLEEGDVLLAQIRARVYNHAAIFLGDNQILHQLVGGLSCREPLTRWQRYFTIRMRLGT